jgi:hypothetical protein
MTDDGRIHYRDSKPPRVRRALPITADAKRRRRYLSRLTDEENEARLQGLDVLAAQDLKDRRSAEAAEQDRQRAEHNARNLEQRKAEIAAETRRDQAAARAAAEARRRVDEQIRRENS